MKGYRFFRVLLSPIYKFWYNPKIIGKENIPKEGSIILAGNHIHIMDQCNIIVSTRRLIHYMAKKEYFDNKKVAWFFKIVGCIPVDRSKKDENAKTKALEVLREGHALGVFPEGTRNILKEDDMKKIYNKYFSKNALSYKTFKNKIKKEKKSLVYYLEELKDNDKISNSEFIENMYNVDDFLLELINKNIITKEEYCDHLLLPLKYGVVSMASKTDALIVPYSINGKYKFRSNNLKIVIGQPFKVESELEEANIKLDNEIKKLLKNSD